MKIIKSFQVAIRGIIISIKSERNIKIHVYTTLLVLILGFLLKISLIEWIILSITISIVITAELFNTAIEKTCNILRDKYQLSYDGSRDIRDISAGAVLITAISAVIVGVLIFIF